MDDSLSSFWHAADTQPLEGLLVLRCAIYDPLAGSQIWKMKATKMGVQDLIFAFVNMLHMLWYVHQGAGGRGGVLMFLTSTSFYVTEHVAVVKCCQHVAHAVVYSSGGGGCINVPDEYFLYVTEHVAVVKCCQHVAHAVVYSSGCGGCINVPDEYFSYVTEHVAVVKCCQHGAHAVVYSSRGWGGCINVPDEL